MVRVPLGVPGGEARVSGGDEDLLNLDRFFDFEALKGSVGF